MKLVKIDLTNSKEVRDFIQFPFHLYKDNPYWVPVMSSEMKKVMNKSKHPFYKHSKADFFLIESESDTLGRIAVLQNKNYNSHHHKKFAFFYYFDAVDDPQVTGQLFDAAVAWAKKENLSHIMGPKGFVRSNGVGLLKEGFKELPAMGIAYNYEYYDKLVTQYGFQKETDHLSGFMDHTHQIPDKIHEAADRVKKRGNFWVKSFANNAEMHKWIPIADEVHMHAFQDSPNYTPSTEEEFQMIANTMIQIAEPGLIKLIMKDQEVAGFIIAYPNVNRAIQETKGEIWPLGWIKILQEKKRTTICDLNGLGLLPEYQGLGANILLYHELEKTLRQHNFTRVELVQVDERNFKSKSDMENMGVNWYKSHRSYRLAI